MPEDIQHIYLDSCVIIGYIKEEDEKHKVSQNIIFRIKRMIKNKTISVYVPSLALAEVLEEITDEKIFYRFNKLRKKVLPFRYQNIDFETINIALDIRRKDDRIEPQDSLIVASAIKDPYSIRFLTFDSKILNSVRLREYVRSRSNRKKKLSFSSGI
ncbi:MAG: PIN domain-containing protein [Thermoproteales archaeon]|nr:PIN domain-containing protein [Thermoproteales archaeon]